MSFALKHIYYDNYHLGNIFKSPFYPVDPEVPTSLHKRLILGAWKCTSIVIRRKGHLTSHPFARSCSGSPRFPQIIIYIFRLFGQKSWSRGPFWWWKVIACRLLHAMGSRVIVIVVLRELEGSVNVLFKSVVYIFRLFGQKSWSRGPFW